MLVTAKKLTKRQKVQLKEKINDDAMNKKER